MTEADERGVAYAGMTVARWGDVKLAARTIKSWVILARKPEQKAVAAPVRKAYEARKWQRVKAAMALLRQAAPQA